MINRFYNKGKNHPAYKNGKGRYYYRETRPALERANHKCEICFIDKPLIVHHIDENTRNNDMSNLKVLCISCHRRLHSKYYGMTLEQKLEIQKLKQKINYIKNRKPTFNQIKIEGYITRNETSDILGFTKEMVRQLVLKGKIRGICLLNKKRYMCNKKDVYKYLLKKKSRNVIINEREDIQQILELQTDLPCNVADGQQGIEGCATY